MIAWRVSKRIPHLNFFQKTLILFFETHSVLSCRKVYFFPRFSSLWLWGKLHSFLLQNISIIFPILGHFYPFPPHSRGKFVVFSHGKWKSKEIGHCRLIPLQKKNYEIANARWRRVLGHKKYGFDLKTFLKNAYICQLQFFFHISKMSS